MTVVEKYNPNQSRDERGRFADEDGGSYGFNSNSMMQDEAEELVIEKFGVSIEDFVGATIPEAFSTSVPTVEVELVGDSVQITIGYEGVEGEIARGYMIRGDGKKYAENQIFYLDEELRGKGIGARTLVNQVDFLRKAGFEEINLSAHSSGDDYVGSRVWPRLGFDAPVTPEIRRILPPEVKDAAYVSEIMWSEAGRAAWDKANFTLDMSFDLNPMSVSSWILEEYARRKRLKALSHSDEFDVKLLDEIWDEYAARQIKTKFSPNQPRDERGRFAETGASAPGRLAPQDWANSLNDDELQSINGWLDSDYVAIRQIVSGNGEHYSQDEFEKTERFLQTIEKSAPSPGEYYRGISLDDEDLRAYKKGSIIEFDAPSSLSHDSDVAQEFAADGDYGNAVLLRIQSARAVDLQPLYNRKDLKNRKDLLLNEEEAELIEPPASIFKVVGIRRVPAKNWSSEPERGIKVWEVDLVAVERAAEKKYDPNQPRGRDGKWAPSFGGDTSGYEVKPPSSPSGERKVPPKEWAEGFKTEDWRTVQMWTRTGYTQIREATRDPSKAFSDVKAHAERFNAKIAECEPTPGIYHRGASLNEERVKQFKPGSVVTFDAPTSLSKSNTIAESFARRELKKGRSHEVMFEVRSQRAVDFKPLFDAPNAPYGFETYKSEQELIEPVGSKFRVAKVERVGREKQRDITIKKWKITLEAI
jgi:GNAT superfamily N-acetyltransferase